MTRRGEAILSSPRLLASPLTLSSAASHPVSSPQRVIPEGLTNYPPPQKWDDWTEYDPKAWPQKKLRRYMLIPTVCFNCESACGLLGYVDRDTLKIQKFEGNPRHPGSRGRNCAKGPATLNQVYDPDRILYPLKRMGARGAGEWRRVSWDEALDDIAGRIRRAIVEGRQTEVMYHVGRPGHDGMMEWVLPAYPVYIDGRTDVYDAAFFGEYLRLAAGLPDWAQILERHGVRLMLVEAGSPLAGQVQQAPGWQQLYADEVAEVYERRP